MKFILCIFLVGLQMINIVNGRPHSKSSETEADIPENLKKIGAVNNKTRTRILTHSEGYTDYSDQEVVFPDSYEMIFEPVPRIDGSPKCADGSTFCETFDTYPYYHLKDILKKNEAYKDLFGKDEEPSEITNRLGEDEDMFVCRSFERTIYPKVGKNKSNKWKFIINQGDSDGYIQGVRVETCRSQGSACDIIGDLPNGYVTACKQKYVYRRMLSISDNGRPFPDTFLLPSACCCAYKRDIEFLRRFGSRKTPIK
ncbi:unnamed protein product [Brassicogethes aeneus]|uniref:Spaetzle domain-containing protein n=1 Tax=Brassicogethes aeneus TaxID=1431903 RepID=A0A9P0B2F5_BRAAE|nr:unnamed protein product [Brassicogethes aeneus]